MVSTWQYVVVMGPLRGLRDAFLKILPRKISPIKYWHVSYVAVTRIPSLALRNTWHYGAENFDFLNMSYVAHTRRLYAKCDHGIRLMIVSTNHANNDILTHM